MPRGSQLVPMHVDAPRGEYRLGFDCRSSLKPLRLNGIGLEGGRPYPYGSHSPKVPARKATRDSNRGNK